MTATTASPAVRTLTRDGLGALLAALRADGYQLIGPTVRDGAIVHAEIAGVGDLPAGWTDVQDAGRYRLERRADGALFGYAVGPHSWKPQFFPPRRRLLSIRRTAAGLTFEPESAAAPRLALVGARACDLNAIAIQDRVFLREPYPDADYAARREDTFVVAVQCGQAGGTCFCVSMGTGPRATAGFDVALTELIDDRRHVFVAEAGTTRGLDLLARVASAPATDADCDEATGVVARTAQSMGRTLDTTHIRELLSAQSEHARWDDVAGRCLACSNCTLVCPTCFCGRVDDTSTLDGATAERWQEWDSCFTLRHSRLHGGSVRQSVRSRYRQWLTHKLASWIDQFGTSGCTGCGRCITWCPVGIDLTAEVAALRSGGGG